MHQYSLGMTSTLLHFHKLFTLCFLFFLYFMRQIIVSVDLFSIFILDSKIYSFSIIQHSLFPLSNTAVLGFESSPFLSLWISENLHPVGYNLSPRTGNVGGREFDSGRTITQGSLKITEEKVLPLELHLHIVRLSSLLGYQYLRGTLKNRHPIRKE